MGFFQDLKEDLSQAVNEMIPEEGSETAKAEENREEHSDDFLEGNTFASRGYESETPATKHSTVEVKDSIQRGEQSMSSSRAASDETSVITAGMTISGDIKTTGSIELIGSVIGNIETFGKLNVTGNVQGDSKAAEIYAENAKITGELVSEGSVKIGQSSVVIGNIKATSAVIAGAVKGDIDVRGPVILDTSAIVMGNIRSKSVQINNGAVIEGMCSQSYAEVNPISFFDDIKKTNKK